MALNHPPYENPKPASTQILSGSSKNEDENLNFTAPLGEALPFYDGSISRGEPNSGGEKQWKSRDS
jgi:hypothetical protein